MSVEKDPESMEEGPEVVSSVFRPHDGGPISLLELMGPSDPAECAELRKRIEKSIAPLLQLNRYLGDLAAIGLADPTVYR